MQNVTRDIELAIEKVDDYVEVRKEIAKVYRSIRFLFPEAYTIKDMLRFLTLLADDMEKVGTEFSVGWWVEDENDEHLIEVNVRPV